ncbi:hypothetical protein GCM10017771_58080 [Streptomyces capitiformicae]|uniref:Uncharacterized protein n=1 Tax=Streptomyces capitiformicae TaxID=2014920 RepID=A0A918Z6L9_9ACTN|nr:hypothetical protein GCM10017771_58080 [Streptomyces capitiformicae]
MTFPHATLAGSPSRAELESPDALARSRAGHARGKTVIVP